MVDGAGCDDGDGVVTVGSCERGLEMVEAVRRCSGVTLCRAMR